MRGEVGWGPRGRAVRGQANTKPGFKPAARQLEASSTLITQQTFLNLQILKMDLKEYKLLEVKGRDPGQSRERPSQASSQLEAAATRQQANHAADFSQPSNANFVSQHSDH